MNNLGRIILLRRAFLPLIVGLLSCTIVQAQQNQTPDTADYPYWIEMMQDPNANFFEAQKAFNLYWEGRTIEKGSGWKPFKRWESYMETRVSPTGERPAPDHVWQEMILYNQTQTNGIESISGTWSELGPIHMPVNGTGQPNGLGRINGIAFHPTDSNTFLVGAPAGGLWKTTDGGVTWTSNTDDLPTLGVSSIVYDHLNPSRIFIGTGDRDGGDAPGLGVMRSTNGGNTWFFANSGMGNRTVGMMQMHPLHPDTIIAATNGGIYRTTNGGNAWQLVSSNSSNYKDVQLHPTNPNIVYATANGDFYRSTNNGLSWTQITSGLNNASTRMVIGVTPAAPDYVYILSVSGSSFEAMYRSTDAGLNFTVQSTTPNIMDWSTNGSGSGGQGWYDLCVAIDPNNPDIIYTGGVNIFKSTDGGVTWTINAHWVGGGGAAAIHADQHALEYNPIDGKLYAGHDGGVNYTVDGGVTWPEISDGLAIAQVYKLGQSKTNSELVINGYQDNGTAVYDGSTPWRTEIGGDGMECIVDYTDPNYMYGELYFGNIRRSTNNGVNFSTIATNGVNGITESGAWVTPYILHVTDPNTMFVGYKNIWRSNNVKGPGVQFEQISSNLGGVNNQNMHSLAQSVPNPNILFASRRDNKLYRTDNANDTAVTWVDLSSNLPNNSRVLDIETHPYDENIVYMIQSNKVYKSTNKGGSWTDITGTLPNITKNCLVMDEFSHEGLYVGTDAGVYYIDSNLTNWTAFYVGLPTNVEVSDLEIYHDYNTFSDSRIRASTYGRGLWGSDLYDPGNRAPLANFIASDTLLNICRVDTVKIFNVSAYGPTSWLWQITPSSFSFVNGTDSSSQSPEILFDSAGVYTVTLATSNQFGSDTLVKTNYINVSNGIQMTYFEDFESFLNCPTSNNCGATNCVLISDWYNVPNYSGDSIDWRVDNGGTPSGSTGPSQDYNPGTSAGKYLYTEASSCFNQLALLESPCLDLREVSDPEMEFAYHMNGVDMGDLHIDAYSNGTWALDITNAISGNQGNNWLTKTVSLNNYVGQSIKLRFRGETGPNYRSDMAIDDVGFTAAPLSKFHVNDTTPCLGQVVQFTDESTINPDTWQWQIQPSAVTYVNGTNSNSQHPQVVFNAPGSYHVALVATNNYGFDSETKLNYIHVVVPDPAMSINDADTAICDGDSVTFSTSSFGLNYDFFIDTALVQSSDSLLSYSTNSLTNGQWITLEYMDSNTCLGVDSMQIIVFDLPSPELESDDEDLTICEDDNITFEEIAVPGGNFTFWVDAQLVQSDTLNMYTTNTLQDGAQVSVEVSDVNGCLGWSDTLTVTVLDRPATPDILLLAPDSLESSVMAQSYQWLLDGQPIVGGNQPKIDLTTHGSYQLVIGDGVCLSDTSDVFVYTGTEALASFAANIKIYPNPNKGEFTVFIEQVPPGLLEVELVDELGRRVFSESHSISNYKVFEEQIQLDLAPGAYSLIIKSGGRTSSTRVILH